MNRESFEKIFTQQRPPVTPAALLYVGGWALVLGLSLGCMFTMLFTNSPRC